MRGQVLSTALFPGVIRRWGADVRLIDSMPLHGAIVDMEFFGDTGVACNIGNINPNNGRSGTANRVWYDKDARLQLDTVPFSPLKPFKFFNFWTKHEKFLLAVVDSWKEPI